MIKKPNTLRKPTELLTVEHIGSFTNSGTILIADPCYANESQTTTENFSLSTRITVRPGTYDVYTFSKIFDHREPVVTHAVVVIREKDIAAGLFFENDRPLALIGNDTGNLGFYDPEKYPQDRDEDIRKKTAPNTTIEDIGVVCSTGFGDDEYPIYASYGRGEIVGLLASFVYSNADLTTLLTAYLADHEALQARFRPQTSIPSVSEED